MQKVIAQQLKTDGNSISLGATASNRQQVGQSFAGDGSLLSSITIKAAPSVVVGGESFTIKVYNLSGALTGSGFGATTPNGSAIAVASTSLLISAMVAGQNDITFNFTGANKVRLDLGSNFLFCVDCNNAPTGNPAILLTYYASSEEFNGTMVDTQNSSTWFAYGLQNDLYFNILATDVPASSIKGNIKVGTGMGSAKNEFM